MKNPAAHFVRLSSIVVLFIAVESACCAATVQSAPVSPSLTEIGLTELLVKQKAEESVNEPDWFKSKNYQENGVEYLYVQSEPCTSLIEAEDELGPAVYQVVLQRVAAKLGQTATDEFGRRLKFDAEFVLDNLVRPERNEVCPFKNIYTEEIAQRLGDQYTELFCGYAEVRLNDDFNKLIDSKWDEIQTRGRLISTGVGGISLLSMLLIIFGYLRLNHATRGFYSRRLQMGAGFIALLVLLFCYLLIAALN